MKPILWRRQSIAAPAAIALLSCLGAFVAACESDSLFEGEPAVAPPVAEFDRDATAATAIHGGSLALAVDAHDSYVGIDSVVVRYSGALQGSFARRYSGTLKQVRVDTALPVPFGVEGDVLLEAFAMNRYGSTADVDTVIARVFLQDTVRPTVTMQSAVLPQRAELSGSMIFTVAAQDDAFGSGLAQVGAAVRVGGNVVAESATTDAKSFTTDVVIQVSSLTSAAPGVLAVEYYAWALDEAGNCTAAAAGGVAVGCTFADGALSIPAVPGVTATLQVTATSTFPAAVSAAAIGDLVVDAGRRRLYISNRDNNSVEAVSWAGSTLTPVSGGVMLVGSRPQGMTLDRTGDTLIVANSGGTNLSYVSLTSLQESHRYETRNSALYELSDNVLTHRDYADRPQFVAQDSYGVVFYSTAPTASAAAGTIESVEWDAAWQERENNLMLWSHLADQNGWGPGMSPLHCWDDITPHIQPCIFAFADSVKLDYENPLLAERIEVYDHEPGFPDRKFSFASTSLHAIEDSLRAHGSDVFMYRGVWQDENLDYWWSGDTTLVAASADGSSVAFAEADRNPGRVWAWNALMPHPRLYERLISDVVNIDDLLNNTSAPMNSLTLNNGGTLIATRSADAAFFFTNPLRLLGTYFAPDIAGGAGLSLHPDAQVAGGTPLTSWAAAGTDAPEVALIDTRNFRRVGTIPLLEPVGGPIRVISPLVGDPGSVVAHLFGVTRSGAVFHVPVRSSDINQ